MVLTQLEERNYWLTPSTKFPYHYGSYATMEEPSSVFEWLVSFHTTMVLTQRSKKAAIEGYIRNSFHTTMVLTQPLLLQRYYTGFGEAESTNWEDLVSDIEFTFRRFAWI